MFQDDTSPSTEVKQFMVVYECVTLEDGTRSISPKRRWQTAKLPRNIREDLWPQFGNILEIPADEKEKVIVRQE